MEGGDDYRYHIEQDLNLNLWKMQDYCTFSRVYNFKYPQERNVKNIIQALLIIIYGKSSPPSASNRDRQCTSFYEFNIPVKSESGKFFSM